MLNGRQESRRLNPLKTSGTAISARRSLVIPWPLSPDTSARVPALSANIAGRDLNVHGDFNSSNKIAGNRERPNVANKDCEPQQKHCPRFFIHF